MRAGANILAQKANTLDKIAQAIPAVKAGLIQKLKGGDKGGGGYGAPSSGYGAPTPSYGAPQPPPSYNAPSTGYGVPQGPVLTGGGGASLSSTFNGGGGGGGGGGYNGGNNNNFGGGGGGGGFSGGNNNNFGGGGNFAASTSQYNSGSNNIASNNFASNNFASNNFASPALDSYGTGLTSGTVNNIPLQSSISFGGGSSNFGSSGNSVSQSAPDSYGSPLGEPISNFDNNNNNQILTSTNFNNNNNNQLLTTNFNNNQDSYGSGNSNTNNNNINNILSTNDVQTNFGVDSGLGSSPSAGLTLNNNNPFINSNSLSEQLLLQETRQQVRS